MKATAREAVAFQDVHEREVRIDLRGLAADLNMVNQELVFKMPMASLNGPLVSQDVRQDILDKTGIGVMEIDFLIDSFYDAIQARAVEVLLGKRMKR